MKGFVLTYLLTAVGVVGALAAPRIGLLVYVGFAVLRPPFLWGWAGNMDGLSEAVGIAMLAGWALRGFGAWRLGPARSVVTALLLFTAWSAFSTVQAESTAPSMVSMLELSKIVLPFLVGVTVLESDRDIRQMLWIIVAAQSYVAFEMNLSYVQGYNRAQAEGFGGMDNNCFGISLITTFAAAIGLLFSSSKWMERGIALIGALLMLHTALLTFSRGALLGLLVIGAMAVVMMPKRPRYVAAAVAGLLLTIRLTGPELAARYESAFAETEELDASAAGRLELWRDCLTVMRTEPVFGVGPQNWGVVAERFGWPPGKEAHSVWMQTGAEVGIPGVLALLSFYLLTMFKLWRLVRRRPAGVLPARHAIALGLALAVVGYVVSAQFVSLVGLEVPFYLVMIAVVLLKQPVATADPGGLAAPAQSFARPKALSVSRNSAPIRPLIG